MSEMLQVAVVVITFLGDVTRVHGKDATTGGRRFRECEERSLMEEESQLWETPMTVQNQKLLPVQQRDILHAVSIGDVETERGIFLYEHKAFGVDEESMEHPVVLSEHTLQRQTQASQCCVVLYTISESKRLIRQHRLKDPAKIRFVVDQLRTTPVCGIRRGESVWMLYYRPGISLKIPISRFHLFNSGLYGMYVHLADVCALYVHCHHPLDPPSFSLYRTDQEWTVFCYVFSLLIWLLFVAWGICCCIKCLLVEEEPERDGVNASHTISKKTMPSAIYVENPEGSIQIGIPQTKE